MFFKSLIRTIKTFLKDDPMTYAASLAFYTLASLPGILLISLNILSTAYQKENVKESLLSRLSGYLGPNNIDQMETILDNTMVSTESFAAQIIGWSVLAFSATTVFMSLQNGINRIWNVKPAANGAIIRLIIDRFLSLAMLISVGFILIVSLIMDSIIALLNDWIMTTFSGSLSVFVVSIEVMLSLVINASVFALIYKILPDAKTKWRYIWKPALTTALLFQIGKILIGLYISTTDVGSAYGASGSLVVFLSWAYYSSVIILFGSKLSYEYTLQHEDMIESMEHASFVKEKEMNENSVKTNDLQTKEMT